MFNEINIAARKGANADGYRHFGAGLHVLEDYFAHSNFLELSLRKIGYDKVLPWTSAIDKKGTLPVVTGMFDSEDVVASMSHTLAELFFKVEWEYKEYKPGQPTDMDEAIMILLEEHSDQNMTKAERNGQPTKLDLYKNMMAVRDTIKTLPGQATIAKFLHYTVGSVANANNMVFNFLIQQVGAHVDDAQVVGKGDPNLTGSTDPSHSQLAKDHDTHPFHTLAAELAGFAITNVGRALDKRWDGDIAADPAKIASSFLVHPKFCSWQDEIVRRWAINNPAKIRRGESSTEMEAWLKETEAARRKAYEDVVGFHRKSSAYLQKYYKAIFGEPTGKSK